MLSVAEPLLMAAVIESVSWIKHDFAIGRRRAAGGDRRVDIQGWSLERHIACCCSRYTRCGIDGRRRNVQRDAVLERNPLCLHHCSKRQGGW